jgi:myo-inositol-1(or 4)-monophosphatase
MDHVMDRVSAPEWLAACERIAAAIRAMLAEHPTTGSRDVVVGRGEGGDRTLVIDAAAEALIFAELDLMHEAGERFLAISEERGEVRYGEDGPLRVVIDPIDGSLNAKRLLAPHAVSIAVADGPTMADVAFGFVCELVSGTVWHAARGRGAWRDGVALAADGAEVERRADGSGRLELVSIESAHPRLIARAGPALAEVAHRVRTVGSIAVALCELAEGSFDGMATLWSCRAVDVAAAQLIVREAGGLVEFLGTEVPLGAALDLASRTPIVAGWTATALAELRTLPSSGE